MSVIVSSDNYTGDVSETTNLSEPSSQELTSTNKHAVSINIDMFFKYFIVYIVLVPRGFE